MGENYCSQNNEEFTEQMKYLQALKRCLLND